MVDSHDDANPGPDEDGGIVTTRISPDPETAEYDFLEVVAELEGNSVEDLPLLYDELDHFVERLFDTPPSTAAQVELVFSYAGYRVTINRNGDVKLVPVKETGE